MYNGKRVKFYASDIRLYVETGSRPFLWFIFLSIYLRGCILFFPIRPFFLTLWALLFLKRLQRNASLDLICEP